jgi:hypothetical protein
LCRLTSITAARRDYASRYCGFGKQILRQRGMVSCVKR